MLLEKERPAPRVSPLYDGPEEETNHHIYARTCQDMSHERGKVPGPTPLTLHDVCLHAHLIPGERHGAAERVIERAYEKKMPFVLHP